MGWSGVHLVLSARSLPCMRLLRLTVSYVLYLTPSALPCLECVGVVSQGPQTCKYGLDGGCVGSGDGRVVVGSTRSGGRRSRFPAVDARAVGGGGTAPAVLGLWGFAAEPPTPHLLEAPAHLVFLPNR